MARAGSRCGPLPGRVAVRRRSWATHGHYLDRHLMPVSAYGVARGLLGRSPRRRRSPIDYELARRPSLARTSRWLPRPLAALLDDAAELRAPRRCLACTGRLLNPRIAPLTSMLLGTQMQRASIRRSRASLRRLGVDADWVVFGHVHRLGPLAGDDRRAVARPRRPTASSRTPARGCTSRCWFTAPGRRTRTGPGGAVLLEPGARAARDRAARRARRRRSVVT